MNTRNYKQPKTVNKYLSNRNGMTLPEVIVALLMMTTFTSLFAVVMQFIARFYEGDEKRTVVYQQGFMLNESVINLAFDRWSRILSQPGYSQEDILELASKNGGCTSLPASLWNIPGIEEQSLPKGYIYCIKQASKMEESIQKDLYSAENDAKSGIYMLFAKPVDTNGRLNVSKEHIPVRRLFCRPKPYCTSN